MPELPNPEIPGGEPHVNDHHERVFVSEYSVYLREKYPWLEKEITEIVLSTDSPYEKSELLTHIHQRTKNYFEHLRSTTTIGTDTWSEWNNPNLHADPWKGQVSAATQDPTGMKHDIGRALTRTGLILGACSLLGVATKDYDQALRSGYIGVISYNVGKILKTSTRA